MLNASIKSLSTIHLAAPPPCRADHSRKNSRSLMKMNHEWTRIDTKTDGPPSTASGTKMLLQFSDLVVTMSWDEGFLGARASRPHQAWHSLGHLPHLDQPATAPWVSFGLADAVPADRVAAYSIARKLSAGQRDRMRAGRPRSQGNTPTPRPHGAPSPRALHGFQAADPAGGCLGTSTKTHCPLCPPVSCQEEISKSAQNTPQVGRLSRKSLEMELIRSVNPGLCPTR